MKKYIILALALITACAEKPQKEVSIDISKIASGTYVGVGNGIYGEIALSVTVDEGKITDIVVLETHDTPEIFTPAFDKISADMIANNKTSADAVSGATVSSGGIVEAVKNALTK